MELLNYYKNTFYDHNLNDFFEVIWGKSNNNDTNSIHSENIDTLLDHSWLNIEDEMKDNVKKYVTLLLGNINVNNTNNIVNK